MIELGTVTKDNNRVKQKIASAKSNSMRKDLAYDGLEIEALVTMLTGGDIMEEENIGKYYEYVSMYDDKVISIFLNDFYDNFEFYKAQSHNALLTFSCNSFFDYFHSKIYDSEELNERERDAILFTFLEEFDVNYANYVRKMIKNGQIGYIENFDQSTGIDGKSFWINSLRKNYVLSSSSFDDLKSLGLLVHELGHIYEFKLLTDKNFEQRQGIYSTLLHETCSSFFENEFIEFLKKNKINPLETFDMRDRYLSVLFEQFYQLYILLRSPKVFNRSYFVPISSKTLNKINGEIKRKFGINLQTDIVEFNVNSLLVYSTSMLTALGLDTKYKQDPHYFKKEFDNILMNYGLLKDNDIYERLGVRDINLCKCSMLDTFLKSHFDTAISLGLKK